MKKIAVLIAFVFTLGAVAQSITFVRRPDNTDVTGKSQLPTALGPNGGVKVECLGGTCSGSSGSGTTAIDGGYVVIAGGAKGATTSALITSTAEGVDHQSVDVQIYSGGTAKDPTQIRALTSATDTVVANAGTNLNTSALALDATLTGGTQKAIVRGGAKGATVAADVTSTAQGADHQSVDVQIYSGGSAINPTAIRALTSADTVSVTDGAGPLTVDGTVTTSPPANASTNVAQLAGTTTDTNSGLKSAGTLRVVIATDQPALTNKLLVTPDSVALPANQSVNVSQINAVTPLMGNGLTGTGSQRVTIASDNTAFTVNAAESGTWTVQPGNTANTTPWLATARIVGNTGAVLDAANNAAAPANVVVDGYEAQSSALSTSATAGNVRRGVVGLDGVFYTRQGGPLLFSGGLTAIGATLTQIVAAPAAGTSLYLTDVFAMSDTATAGSFLLRYGTGSNCATGVTTLWPNVASLTAGKVVYPANTAFQPAMTFTTPLKVPAANALCIICVATNTCTASVHGYTAP